MPKAQMQSARKWFRQNGWKPFSFQEETWELLLNGEEGIVNAPTGSGKTYSLLLPIIEKISKSQSKGLQLIWVSPIRALTKEILQSTERALFAMGHNLEVEVRTGDTSTKDKQRQSKKMPHILITTPESLHILFAQKKHQRYFGNLKYVVVDEWHELMGSKRGNLMELALAHFRTLSPGVQTWGISATIGNMEEAIQVLLGSSHQKGKLVRSDIEKKVEVVSVLPPSIDKIPWAGHLGIRLLADLLPLIETSKTSLIFTNTRSQAEIWYQSLLEANPDLSGRMAMHHGSISRELRFWVEDALNQGTIKAVVCTSSLDLGVDFRPVDQIFQIGSPKGVARFLQRAGRSGHQPGATSKIHFIPTHALELVEAAALRQAIKEELVEDRLPFIRSFDILLQYMTTLAVSDGFYPHELYEEVKGTYCFEHLTLEEWHQCLDFLTTGGSLSAYDDYHKVEVMDDGLHQVTSRKIARRHRFSIGAIVSDTMIRVKMKQGGTLGHVEEYFISRLKPGDVFWFAGQNLELIHVREMTATVTISHGKKKGIVTSYMGSRMPLSAQMGEMLRRKLNDVTANTKNEPELEMLQPMLELQSEMSIVPNKNQFLIEYLSDKEGHHLFFYPFEGRFVHEGMAALVAWRIALFMPISFSIAMNDYGFELLSDEPPPLEELVNTELFDTSNLIEDINQSLNSIEMARRRFRDISTIAGLVFQGYPGQQVKERHLQSSSALLFDVFSEYDPANLLLQQAFDEALNFQLEEGRMRSALKRIQNQEIIIQDVERPTPLCFPILVDRLNREKLSTEQLDQRLAKMIKAHKNLS
jgi:ATP-dependent Lhr-like helicase